MNTMNIWIIVSIVLLGFHLFNEMEAMETNKHHRHLDEAEEELIEEDAIPAEYTFDMLPKDAYNDTHLHHSGIFDDPIMKLYRHARNTKYCGYKWQADYKELHKEIEIHSKYVTPRYLVHISGGQGANDRLTGMITSFLLALLSNRSFKILSYNNNITNII